MCSCRAALNFSVSVITDILAAASYEVYTENGSGGNSMSTNPRYAEILDQFKGGRQLDFRHREIVLRAGETPQGVYFIDQGFIKVYTISDRGTENMHVIYKAGELFPLIWIFNGRVRNVFYESVGTSRLFRLTKEEFNKRMHRSAHLHAAVTEQFADQFRIYADRIDNLEYTEALERVAYRLLTLARRFGARRNGQIVINAPITHQHIGESVNLARETVSREIEELEKRKIISHQKRQLVLTDIKALKKIVGEL